jgi:hypothetical protein
VNQPESFRGWPHVVRTGLADTEWQIELQQGPSRTGT